MHTLFVSSTGGHLAELHALQSRLSPAASSAIWVTFDSEQSRALLHDQEVVYMDPVGQRDYRGLLASMAQAGRILTQTRVERVISTGAAVALAFLPTARVRGLSTHYIESAARIDGPSMTGRVLQSLRAGRLYTQHREWAGGPWSFAGSVFDGTESFPSSDDRPVRRVFVSMGTSPYPFSRLTRRLAALLPRDAATVWQTGATDGQGLPGRVLTSLSQDDMAAEMARADVVVCHAGVGSALAAMSAGHCPVLVPRRAAHHEHVDDHQSQLARSLTARGLAVTAEADALDLPHLRAAAATSTRAVETPPAFVLADPSRGHLRGRSASGV